MAQVDNDKVTLSLRGVPPGFTFDRLIKFGGADDRLDGKVEKNLSFVGCLKDVFWGYINVVDAYLEGWPVRENEGHDRGRVLAIERKLPSHCRGDSPPDLAKFSTKFPSASSSSYSFASSCAPLSIGCDISELPMSLINGNSALHFRSLSNVDSIAFLFRTFWNSGVLLEADLSSNMQIRVEIVEGRVRLLRYRMEKEEEREIEDQDEGNRHLNRSCDP